MLNSLSEIDSFKVKLKTASDKEKIQIYLGMAKLTELREPDSAMIYARNVIALSEKIGDWENSISATLLLGNLKSEKGNYLEAYIIYNKCLKLSAKNKLTESEIQSLLKLAVFHNSLGESEKAIVLIEKALKLSLNSNRSTIADVYFELGFSHIKLKNNKKALSYFKKSAAIYEEVNDSLKYVRTLNYIGKIYLNKDEYETAKIIDFEALSLAKKLNDDWITSLVYNDLAWAYYKQDDFEQALEYNIKALESRKQIDYKYGITSSLINIGILYKNYNKTDLAIQYLNNALLISENTKFFASNNFKKKCYKILSEIYEQKKDYKNSQKYLSLYLNISNLIDIAERNDERSELEIKYQIENLKDKQKVQEQLQIQKDMFFRILGIIIVLIIFGIIYMKYVKKKKQNTSLKNEIEERIAVQKSLDEKNIKLELMSNIMRHDIANGLAVIQSGLNIFFKNKDEQILKEVYSKNRVMVNLIHDIRNSKLSNSQLNIFKLSDIINELKPKFNVEIIQKNNCSFSAINTISSVFNNILENAVSHGKATRIEIECKTKDNGCEIKIENNGTDIPPKIISRIFDKGFKHGNAANTGMGLSIVKKAMEQSKGSVSVMASKPHGAVFILTFGKST